MKNDSCLTVSRRAAIIRQDAEENYGTLLTLGESMRRAYQVEELIDRMRWDNADFFKLLHKLFKAYIQTMKNTKYFIPFI